jgi:hypothetical protein
MLKALKASNRKPRVCYAVMEPVTVWASEAGAQKSAVMAITIPLGNSRWETLGGKLQVVRWERTASRKTLVSGRPLAVAIETKFL